jgi:hypothetical protein
LRSDSIGHCEKKSYEHVSNSESCLNLITLYRIFVCGGWMKSEVYKRNMDRRDELLARILDIAARIKKRED